MKNQNQNQTLKGPKFGSLSGSSDPELDRMRSRAAFAFCRIMQDGDDEGGLHLDRLPTPAEAVLIREALGIRKRCALTEDSRAQLDAARRAANSPSNPSFIEQNARALSGARA